MKHGEGLSDRGIQDEPFAYYHERLEDGPVWLEDDIELYVIGGHTEARAALMDVATFSSRPARKLGAPDPGTLAYLKVLSDKGWARTPTLQRTDPPVHTHYRKLLNRVFTPARVKELTPRIEEIATSLVDGFAAAGRCEFVSDFALPLPGILIAEQIGLSPSEYKTFRRWADAMLSLAQRPMSVDEAVAEAEIEVEAQHFLAEEFERRRDHPTDDLISLLVNAHGDDEEPFTVQELQDLMHQLITGGFETTTGALAAGMLLLVQHPDQLARLQDEPELLKNFIEEALRFDSPVQGLWRQAACPASVGGVDIPQGASVMVRYGCANRDPSVFDDPDTFDITRADARNHVAFGFGNHFCVGATLARQEMLTGFSTILARLQDIELAEPLPSPAHDASFFLRPMKELHLRFTAI